ncbi:uncharacterized protein B0H18DRAFT_280650 [Fomitopsis serialis]|uniref:uncharacterized protein n=1 Tax=Fomitopsis serialis TaxID=139415 RepID=UPI002007F559|nr:uncharacterized protein B0H18DRAFT_280650 [Neoantrodia serialis]KAH9927600.1 hypothetical protein B0H18DRAFT_280650 [Neoantrodia serialis]
MCVFSCSASYHPGATENHQEPEPPAVTSSSSTVEQTPTRAAHPEVLYPKLPSDWYENDRYWVLGWDANHPRLKAFVEKNTPPEAEDISYYIRALDLLEWCTRFRPIQLCTVLPDDAPIPPLTGKDEVPRIMLVSICFTARLPLYKRRPTKEQYKWLKQLFGCRPRWYRDSLPKNEFHLHLIE